MTIVNTIFQLFFYNFRSLYIIKFLSRRDITSYHKCQSEKVKDKQITFCQTHRKEAILKRNAYNTIYSDNSLNIRICLTTSETTDGIVANIYVSNCITRLDLKTVLSHICQFLRLTNHTSLHNTYRVRACCCQSCKT